MVHYARACPSYLTISGVDKKLDKDIRYILKWRIKINVRPTVMLESHMRLIRYSEAVGLILPVLGGLALPALLIGCASVNKTVYKPDQLRGIGAWTVVFAYEPGRVEIQKETSGEAGVKVVTEGRDPRDLQLRDDIMFRLQDKHGLTVTKDADGPVGQIRIHPVHFINWGGFKSLDVTLASPSGDTLARIKLKNGDRVATVKDDDEFAEYAADAIASVIRKAK